MMNINALEPEKLYRGCDPEQFSFETTDDLENVTEIIGQPRAVAAIQFGMEMERKGTMFSPSASPEPENTP
ncbi:MAG: hypothetical protein ACOCWY_03470 [Thermodesulfobacteriota bacterium]